MKKFSVIWIKFWKTLLIMIGYSAWLSWCIDWMIANDGTTIETVKESALRRLLPKCWYDEVYEEEGEA